MEDLWAIAVNPRATADISAAQVQFALLPQALKDADRTLAVDRDDSRITARF